MKGITVSLLFISLSVFVSIFGITRLNNVSAQQPPKIEAAILRCGGVISRPLFEVLSYTGSAGAPSITIGTNCAQALADLFNNGFEIRKVSDDLIMYILVKEVSGNVAGYAAWM